MEVIPLIILLMCTPHGDTMKVRSVEVNESAPITDEVRAEILDRNGTCAEKIAQFLGETREASLDASIRVFLPFRCNAAPPVPLLLRDTLFTLTCEPTPAPEPKF